VDDFSDMRHSECFGAVIEEALANGTSVRFRAEGDSMYPTIRDGDTITVTAVATDDVVRGDVLLCRHGARWLAHRVVGEATRGGERVFEMRGDAKGSSDAPVTAAAVAGRVVSVHRDGRLIRVCGPAARMRRAVRAAASRARACILQPRVFSSPAPMLYGYHHQHAQPAPSTRGDRWSLPS
jgi:signal peptidase I